MKFYILFALLWQCLAFADEVTLREATEEDYRNMWVLGVGWDNSEVPTDVNASLQRHGGKFYVFRVDGHLLGFICARRRSDNVIEIDNIVIAQRLANRNGYAKEMIQKVIEAYPSQNYFMIQTFDHVEDNEYRKWVNDVVKMSGFKTNYSDAMFGMGDVRKGYLWSRDGSNPKNFIGDLIFHANEPNYEGKLKAVRDVMNTHFIDGAIASRRKYLAKRTTVDGTEVESTTTKKPAPIPSSLSDLERFIDEYLQWRLQPGFRSIPDENHRMKTFLALKASYGLPEWVPFLVGLERLHGSYSVAIDPKLFGETEYNRYRKPTCGDGSSAIAE